MAIKVVYPLQVSTIFVSAAEYDLVHSIYNVEGMGRKVIAVKFIRNQYAIDLYNAKMICETIAASPRYPAETE